MDSSHDMLLRIPGACALSDSGEISLSSGGDVLSTEGTIWPTSVRPIRVLGHGRAAEARLVTAVDKEGRDVVCVEKIFHPGLLTRLIYRVAYLAGFPYQQNADAIQACFYRRRLAATIVEVMLPEAAVARPLYVRWDSETQAYVLASEFIRGCGIIPQDVDRRMVRRWLARRLGWNDRATQEELPPDEMSELLQLMTRLESLLLECGLTGSGWQVCKRALVSTANLLRTESGYVVVDLESGIPSVLVPIYVLQALRLRSLPLFDDLDGEQLRNWLVTHQERFAASLASAKIQQLWLDVDCLIRHTENWKLSEPAPGRKPLRMLTADFRRRFRAQTLAFWRRSKIVDEGSADHLAVDSLFFVRPVFLFGLVPGRVGRFAQRWCANSEHRRQVNRLLRDSEYRKQCLSCFVKCRAEEWKKGGRISRRRHFTHFNIGFLLNLLLSKTVPKALHRWLDDEDRRKDRFLQMLLFFGSAHFQSEYGRFWIRSRIRQWHKSGRVTDEAAAVLNCQLDSPAVEEYVRGFGLHAGLKLFLPLVMPLKVGGAAASLASGNPFYFLFMLMLVPILRTSVTLWRMVASQQPASGFRQALLVGVMPVVGSLAFPIQMSACYSELSMFLLRDFASRLGCLVPIYGGKDSRTELLAIRLVNFVAEGLDIWLSLTGGTSSTSDHAPGETVTGSGGGRRVTSGRWDFLAAQQIRKLRHESDDAEGNEDLPPVMAAAEERRVA